MTTTRSSAKRAAKPSLSSKRSLSASRAKSAAEKANATRAKELRSLVRRKKAQIVDAFCDIGEALLALSQKKLCSALDCESFEQLLKKHELMSSAQAYKLMKIVNNVPRDTAVTVEQERVFALLTFTEATPEADTVSELVKKNVTVGHMSVREASRRHIEAAVEELRDKARASTPKGRLAAKTAARGQANAIAPEERGRDRRGSGSTR